MVGPKGHKCIVTFLNWIFLWAWKFWYVLCDKQKIRGEKERKRILNRVIAFRPWTSEESQITFLFRIRNLKILAKKKPSSKRNTE